MKHSNKLLATVGMLLLFTGCSDEMITPSLQSDTYDCEYSQFISTDEAIQYAKSALKDNSNLFGGNKNRSFTVKNSRLYTPPTSRVSDKDGSFYIVNFDEGGFALVGAKRDLHEKIYVFSDKGIFDPTVDESLTVISNLISETIANDSPSILDSIPDAVGYANISQGDYIDLATVEVMPGVFCIPRMTKSEEKVDPKLKTDWEQSDPYNKYCFTETGLNAPVGCGPLAMGQIFAYHHKPESYNGYQYPWDEMTAYPVYYGLTQNGIDGIAKLVRHIGLEANADYQVAETTTYIDDMHNAIKKFGYDNAILTQYYVEGACNSVKNDGPVYFKGSTGKGKGHAWVVDGYKSIITTITYIRTDDNSIYDIRGSRENYLHCVWGGIAPDFYLYGNFNMTPEYEFNTNIRFIYKIK